MSSVSVVIPCRNAERWVAEAVRSCLEQDVDVEVVVVDDGSTDGSRDALAEFRDRVTILEGAGSGAPAARNLGVARSDAPYVQFLDADDILLPGKLRPQLDVLETGAADVVYSDWRYGFQGPDGMDLGGVVRSGHQPDVVEALLDDWWFPTMSALHRRSAVDSVGGWDPAVRVGQDHDFHLSLAISGAVLRYVPGAETVYRRHDEASISRRDPVAWLLARAGLLAKAERALSAKEALVGDRRAALARSYLRLAWWLVPHDRSEAEQLHRRAVGLAPEVVDGLPAVQRSMLRTVGFGPTARLFVARKRFRTDTEDPHPLPGRTTNR